VFLVTNDFGVEKFAKTEKSEFVVVDLRKDVVSLRDDVKRGLNGKVKGFEVAVNITSGSGKEHMALLSALMKLGVGFRIVSGEGGFKEL